MRILITGITGQDGSILSDLHRHRGDQVWGTASSFASVHNPNIERIIVDRFEDPKVFNKILDQKKYDELTPYAMALGSAFQKINFLKMEKSTGAPVR